MPSKLNIFTEIAIETGNHGVIVGYLNEIIAEINVLISGVRGYGSIELDIGLDVFGGIVYDLIQVRHCFLISLYYYLMRYSLAYRGRLTHFDQH